ncbi:MAG: hypothetical protein M3N30_07120 [Bacteroidota bacterium]|nr:hypothetical protein [Bacteroidota bacterium]
MPNRPKTVSYLGVLILFFLACSKNGSPVAPVVPSKTCNIIAATLVLANGNIADKYTFQYDSANRLIASQDSAQSYSVSYSYSGKTIYRAVAAGIYSSVDTITLNDAGLIAHDKEVVGTSVHIMNFTYDANMQLTTYTEQQDAYPPVSSSYYFTNGDNTLSISAGSQDTLTYDLSKLAVAGNLDQFYQLLYLGAMRIKNKHLVVSQKHGAIITDSYTFNADGNISSVTTAVNGGNSSTLSYTYDCK